MTQQVIDGVLYSQVLAHSLERGDIIIDPRPWRDQGPGIVTYPVEIYSGRVDVYVQPFNGKHHRCVLRTNEPVLRAVGARAGRGGAR